LPTDFEDINYGLTANPASFFRCNLMLALQTVEGRLTVDNDAFRRWRHGGAEPEEEVLVGGEEHLRSILVQHFGVRLPDSVPLPDGGESAGSPGDGGA
jgi:arylamine N-acetyltransferase